MAYTDDIDELLDYGRDAEPLLLQTLLDRGAQVQPENLIITKTASGYAKITFREHRERSMRLGAALIGWGVRIGDRVGTLMWNTDAHLQCIHAICCIGAVLQTLNARLGAQDLSYTVQHARDRVIIAEAKLLNVLGELDGSALRCVELLVCAGHDGVPGAWTLPPSLRRMSSVVDYEAFLSEPDPNFRWPTFPETTPHYLCYTSGTTSKPKGVVYSHRSSYLALMTANLADEYGICGASVVSFSVPMFHILGWHVPLLALMFGTRTVLTGDYTQPEHLLEIMRTWQVEWTAGVPAVWQRLREVIQEQGVSDVRKSLKLRRILAGGSPPAPECMEWYARNLGLEFMQGWGMTETNALGTNAKYRNAYRDRSKGRAEQYQNLARAGLHVPGMVFRIADPNNLDREVEPGSEGELLARGPLVITKYFGGEAPEKFHNGWLITGDIAKLDENQEVVICDRSKDFIKSGGEWIASAALEAHIGKMGGISMVAVVGVPHRLWGERPVAITTFLPGHDPPPDLTELVREHCSRRFAKFQLPDAVAVWESLPLTAAGKVDKKEVRRILARGSPAPPDLGPPVALAMPVSSKL